MLTKCVKSRLQSGRHNAISENFKKEKNLGSTSFIESIHLKNRESLSIIMVVETRFHSMTFSDTVITLCILIKFFNIQYINYGYSRLSTVTYC